MNTINDIRLVQTCGACPEQYDAFIGEKQVGYLRLRHGFFRVDYPECGGKTIYEAHPKGDGIFDSEERELYLEAAKEAILREVNSDSVRGRQIANEGEFDDNLKSSVNFMSAVKILQLRYSPSFPIKSSGLLIMNCVAYFKKWLASPPFGCSISIG